MNMPICFLCTAQDLLSVSIVIPSITRHARNLGASPAMVGIIGLVSLQYVGSSYNSKVAV